MSKVISVTDLKLIDGLAHLNFMEMIHPDNDELVHGYLHMMGFDIEEGIEYRAYQHRNMQGNIVINYVLSGDMLLDRVSLTSPFSTFADRMIAASIYDRSLFEQLYDMGHCCSGYGSQDALDENVPGRDNDEYYEEEKKVAQQIRQLEEILFHIRGEQFKPDGSLKAKEDYKTPAQSAEKARRKRKKKVKEGSVDE